MLHRTRSFNRNRVVTGYMRTSLLLLIATPLLLANAILMLALASSRL